MVRRKPALAAAPLLALLIALAGCGGVRPTSALSGPATGTKPAPSAGTSAGAPGVGTPPGTSGGPATGRAGTGRAGTATGGGTGHTTAATGSTARPGPTVKAYIDQAGVYGGAGTYACPTAFEVSGTITSTKTLDLTYYFDITVNNTDEIKSTPATLHIAAGGSAAVDYSFPTKLYPTIDLAAIIRITNSDIGTSTNLVPFHSECGGTVFEVDTTPATCGHTTTVTAHLSIPDGPHAQAVRFDFGAGSVVDKSVFFPVGGSQAVTVSVDRLLTDPHKPVTVTVSAPPFARTVTKTLTCTTPTP